LSDILIKLIPFLTVFREVASGTGHGLETDIFSLGSVLYTMLVGGPPFESSNVQDTINNIKGVLYKMPNLLSAKAQHLIMSVMRLNPNDRLSLNGK
jgi:polo-like kinase 1